MENLFLDPTIILLIAAFGGFFMAFGIGANDVANAMGTSVGSKAITFKQAIYIAAIFDFLGAYLAGGEVTSTIRKGIVSPDLYVFHSATLLTFKYSTGFNSLNNVSYNSLSFGSICTGLFSYIITAIWYRFKAIKTIFQPTAIHIGSAGIT